MSPLLFNLTLSMIILDAIGNFGNGSESQIIGRIDSDRESGILHLR